MTFPRPRRLGHLVLRLAELARRKHYYCEDLWYSCPKHPDGCANDGAGPDCNCGADRINAEVDAILSELTQNATLHIPNEAHRKVKAIVGQSVIAGSAPAGARRWARCRGYQGIITKIDGEFITVRFGGRVTGQYHESNLSFLEPNAETHGRRSRTVKPLVGASGGDE